MQWNVNGGILLVGKDKDGDTMANIFGNTPAVLQVKAVPNKNEIGEGVKEWEDYCSLNGWLDCASGEADTLNYSAKIQESTHIYICDYQPLAVTPENSRLVIGGIAYEILIIDNPLGMNEQLEIYLKYVGRCL